MSRVQIQNLAIRFGANTVLQDLSLDVASGEFLVLLGPSGCGKSTLLHSIAGLNAVSDGRIFIGDVDMTRSGPSDRGVGMVFQSYALYPHMSVRDNIGFPLKMAGVARREIARRVEQVAAMLQLEPLLERKPGRLSGGQRQRVAIGRALVREARVLLLDEPLSNLDAQLRTELRRELKLLHARLGNTMIHVTHDQVEAMTLADRIVVMHEGKILQCGTPIEVHDQPCHLRVATFVGSPGINQIGGRVAQGRWRSASLDLPAPGAEGAALTLGVRPEHVRIGPDQPFGGRIELIEPLGSQHLLWIAHDGRSVCALLPGQPEHVEGSAVAFGFDPQRLLWFDDAGARVEALPSLAGAA